MVDPFSAYVETLKFTSNLGVFTFQSSKSVSVLIVETILLGIYFIIEEVKLA